MFGLRLEGYTTRMRSPYVYALAASLYIAFIATFLNNASKILPNDNQSVIGPIILLSLLVLSVTVMGFLFFYEPLRLYLSGEQKQAMRFFARTVGTFTFVTFALIAALVLSVRHDELVIGVEAAPDYKDATYLIDGTPVTLVNGAAETEAAPGSASKITTKYFGNELSTDLNGDGRTDVVFLLTQETGGSGVFYYAVAALNTPEGYVGSDGYLLGDRIAPQSTTVSQNPKQVGVVVVNYADRAAGEPMSARPSEGKSVYLKLDPATMRWGIVEPNFPGESR